MSSSAQEFRGVAAGAVPGSAPERRVLPHDTEAERSVLGALLIDSGAMELVADALSPASFYAERHRRIYAAAVELFEKGEPIDVVTLRAVLSRNGSLELIGGDEYLADLSLVVPTAASVSFYADIVLEHAIRRRLIEAGGEIASLGFDQLLEAADALDKAQQKVYAIDQDKMTEAVHIAPILNSTWSRLETLLSKKSFITGVPTNFSELDGVTHGLQPGELIILAARPSVGKTAFALNLARNAAVLGHAQVLFFSLEMSQDSLVQRLICSEAGVDSHLLKTGQADTSAYQRIAHAMERLNQCDMWFDDTPSLPLSALRARARRMKTQHDIKLIVIDYLQLMQGGRQESRVQEVSDISAGLKAVAKELQVPVLALSQLSRESEKREKSRPQLSDLRDSGSIEQDADVVLFLYRPGMRDENIDRSQTSLIVAKNRNGPVRDIELVFKAEQTRFYDPHRGE